MVYNYFKMTNFVPGKIVAKITLKDGSSAVIRYPKWEDLESLLEYTNTISNEDTFILMSGEETTFSGQAGYLAGVIDQINNGFGVTVLVISKNKVIGLCDINKIRPNRIRVSHRAALGISIAKDYRGFGIGKILLTETIEQAKLTLTGLKMLELTVFEINTKAVNLYQKLGFKIVGKIEGGYYYKGNYETQLQMILNL